MSHEIEDLYHIVRKLSGPIYPTGEHSLDIERLENVKLIIKLFEALYDDIEEIANEYAESQYDSEKQIGLSCLKCLEYLYG